MKSYTKKQKELKGLAFFLSELEIGTPCTVDGCSSSYVCQCAARNGFTVFTKRRPLGGLWVWRVREVAA